MLPGQVVSTQTLPDYGITVRINHGHDANGDAIETRYCHLSAQTVKYGDWVAEGQQVGVMGSTGSLTKQVHLHSELWFNGTRIDERTYTPPTPPTPPPSKENSHMRHLLKYTSATPDMWIEIDFLDHTYTLIAPGSFEDAVINNDVAAGRRWDEIADPDWGQSFGNGQYRNITKPDEPVSQVAAPTKFAITLSGADLLINRISYSLHHIFNVRNQLHLK